MTTRSSSSSSSSSSSTSESEERTAGTPTVSRISENIRETTSNYRAESSNASHDSAIATGTPYDSVSIATTNTGFTSASNFTGNTSVSQQQVLGGGIPIIRAPGLQSQLELSGSNIAVVNQPMHIDVASAQQQYQQYNVQPEISPYSGSTVTSSGTSLSSPSSAAQAVFRQADTNGDVSVIEEEVQQWTQTTNQTGGQYQYQQAQFANQLPGQQPFSQLFGADAFGDTLLNIDYGVIEAYNVGLQSAGDITAEQHSGRFDVAKAMFKQADTNRDGSISRDEFHRWAQGSNQPNFGAQPYSNYQTTTNNYDNNFYQGQSYGNTNPELASILQQSGLAQGYANYA